MAPKAKFSCPRCPSAVDPIVKCRRLDACRRTDGEYEDIANRWPEYPNDPDTSFSGRSIDDCNNLLSAIPSSTFEGSTITKQMLEDALHVVQESKKSGKKAGKAAAKVATVASSSKTTPSKGPAPASTIVATPVQGVPEAAPASYTIATQRIPAPESSKAERETTTVQSVQAEHPSTPASESPSQPADVEIENELGELSIAEPSSSAEPPTLPVTENLIDPTLPYPELSLPPARPVQTNGRAPMPNRVDVQAQWTKSRGTTGIGSKEQSFTARPGILFPDLGQAQWTRSNHFLVKLDETKCLFIFEVDGIPDKASRAKKRKSMETMMLNCPILSGHREDFATDYKSKIVAWKDLREGHTDVESLSQIVVPNYSRDGTAEAPTTLRLRFTTRIPLSDLGSHIRGVQINYNSNEVVQALNILISKGVEQNGDQSVEVGSNRFYFKPGYSNLGNTGLMAIRGYTATVRPCMQNVLLNVNTGVGAFYQPITVEAFIDKFNNNWRLASQYLKGVRVRIMYNRSKDKNVLESHLDSERRRTKSILAVDDRRADQRTFNKDGHDITVVTYFRNTYPGYRVRRPELPAINAGSADKPCWFLPEFLSIIAWQLYKHKLSPAETSAMIEQACRDPEKNRSLIVNEGLPAIGISPNANIPLPEVLQNLNIGISRDMIQVPAHVVRNPSLWGGLNSGKNARLVPNIQFGYRWQFNRKMPPHEVGQKYRKTHYIYCTSLGDLRQVEETLTREMQSFGCGNVVINSRDSSTATAIDGQNWAQSVSKMQAAFVRAKNNGADLMVFSIPERHYNAAYYKTFKQMADQVYGIKSQVLQQRGGGKRGFAAGVALKLNCKLGNLNHAIENGLQELKKGNVLTTMILGADVTHPGPGCSAGTPSIAACVGSVDDSGGRLFGSMRKQTERTEIIAELESMVFDRLLAFSAWGAKCKPPQKQPRLPTRIVYYRDGVGDSQFSAVKDVEIPAIRKAYSRALQRLKLPTNKSVQITTLIVSKRHATRFYPMQGSEIADKHGNSVPGTYVESAVTSPSHWDFYLSSHYGLKGTARPCHYFVIGNDDNNWSLPDLVQLTHRLCWVYQRSSCPVSYATPTYYADRLCERGRAYLGRFTEGQHDAKGKSEETLKKAVDGDWDRSGRIGRGERKDPWAKELDETMFWL